MNTIDRRRLTTVLAATLVLAASARADFMDSADFNEKYEADVLPTAADYTQTGAFDTGPSLLTGQGGSDDGNVLRFGTAAGTTAYWTSDNWPADNANGWSVEVRAKVISSSGSNGAMNFNPRDSNSRVFMAIGGSRYGQNTTTFDTTDNTDGFHTFRAVQPPNSTRVRAFRDGKCVGTTTVGNSGTDMLFGDNSVTIGGEVHVDYVRFDAGAHAPDYLAGRTANSVIETSGQNRPDWITDKYGSPWTIDYSGSVSLDLSNDGEDYVELTASSGTRRTFVFDGGSPDTLTPALSDAEGWRFTARVKVVNTTATATTINEATDVLMEVRDGSDRWTVCFDENGALWRESNDAVSRIFDYDTTSAYATWTITYDPAADGGSGGVTIAVDGEVKATKTRTDAYNDTGTEKIFFGDNTTAANGVQSLSRWSLVRFETGPFETAPKGTIVRFQ